MTRRVTHGEIQPRAVVLLSGGLDSTTALAMQEEFACYTLAFRYGQRHAVELASAERVSRAFGALEHRVCDLDLRWIGGSALTADVPVPKDRKATEIACGVPITYVPARNAIFLSVALAWAEAIGAEAIVIGANALDYSGYPDCRPEFLAAWETMARLGTVTRTKAIPIRLLAPLIKMTKAEIIREGLRRGVDYSITHSCYDPIVGVGITPTLACGSCDSCLLRKKGFAEAGVSDPTRYA